MHTLHQEPSQFGIERTRWTLETIAETSDWLSDLSISGIWRILSRLGISRKLGREYMYSPDPDYIDKLTYIQRVLDEVQESNGSIALLYLDEVSYFRQPKVSQAYEKRGDRYQALARRSYRSDTKTRVVGALDAIDGRVIYRQGSAINTEELVKLYIMIREIYHQADRIYVAQDNWPVHFHPNVLVALEPQESVWPMYRPPDWSDEASKSAREKYGSLSLPIQILPLPTYASWTNPIEKLWRKLKQELLHMHRYADRLDELREKVKSFLDQFAFGSNDLLRYVGLLIPY